MLSESKRASPYGWNVHSVEIIFNGRFEGLKPLVSFRWRRSIQNQIFLRCSNRESILQNKIQINPSLRTLPRNYITKNPLCKNASDFVKKLVSIRNLKSCFAKNFSGAVKCTFCFMDRIKKISCILLKERKIG